MSALATGEGLQAGCNGVGTASSACGMTTTAPVDEELDAV